MSAATTTVHVPTRTAVLAANVTDSCTSGVAPVGVDGATLTCSAEESEGCDGNVAVLSPRCPTGVDAVLTDAGAEAALRDSNDAVATKGPPPSAVKLYRDSIALHFESLVCRALLHGVGRVFYSARY